MNNWI